LDPENLSLVVAFSAGVLSFLSPCVLPLVPAYVGYLAGSTVAAESGSARLVTVGYALAFVLGFSLVFVTFWASIGLIGFVLPMFMDIFRQVGGVILILMGLHELGVFRISMLYRQFRYEPKFGSRATALGAFMMGVAFAAGWTPCIGPILAGIIGLATLSDTVGQGTALLIAYSAGLGVPFIAAGAAIGQVGALMNRVKRHMRWVSIISGVLLIGIGLMMLSDTFKLLPAYFNWTGV
jgi:cytochrome c-type biogenesis protein